MPSESVELLQSLIRNECVNTHSPESGNEHRSVATLVDFFGRSGEVVEPAPGRQSLVFRVPGTDPSAPSLALVPHLDVVPADPGGWSRDPYAAEIADGFVWGRGAVDMLNMAASFAVAARPYIAGEIQPTGDLVFAAVADEEGGGRYGSRHLVEDHWELVKADYLLTEVGYPSPTVGSTRAIPVTVAEKGSFFTRLKAVGKPGHGASPYRADDALRKLVTALHGIYSAAAPVSIPVTWGTFVDGLGVSSEEREALQHPDTLAYAIDAIAQDDEQFAAYIHAATHLTVSPNQALAGTKSNVIAHLAKSLLDIRANDGTDRTAVNAYLVDAMGPIGSEIEIKSLGNNEATSSLAAGPLWDAVGDAVEAVEGHRRLIPTVATVATDARYWRRRGTVAYGVGLYGEGTGFSDLLNLFHGHDERISIESVNLTTALYQQILDRFLGENHTQAPG